MKIIDLGIKEYGEVWELQKGLVLDRAQNIISNTLLLVEHPHVITKGRRSKNTDIVHVNAPVFEVERGGEVTYHGPGQLVGYPIVYIHRFGVKKYMELLEEVVIQTLKKFDIHGERKAGATGVWVHSHPERSEGSLKKIASLGVAVKKWVTYHGFALNVNTDLEYFKMIRPCGFDASVMTSIKEILQRDVDMQEIKRELSYQWKVIFGSWVGGAEGEAPSPRPQRTRGRMMESVLQRQDPEIDVLSSDRSFISGYPHRFLRDDF
ncbi:MAG: lipoyl(octanoyl) transferase [Deltaproteobacteria bacterium GWA2_38_16]|nr:MAG: lipoyl(octanoyl) transferase [Deltaproteobacteria bacterium GWA2_38_16]OGQ02447.1 MAG: lipoyl(octanoyl) transferase [Deltaproteobacteria bacterium RIFCSPHIGHO2_02_FULL_38_15]OGQ59994.1 MAG: lipoyl(octanoyl) transferase [Deltaproteobacteria bacterium RIFCSPLOWO2_12_FULL_38_8]HBQ21100.1 lipoyl(octanoyl) transferase [Deltaproteobacteria bacterium]